MRAGQGVKEVTQALSPFKEMCIFSSLVSVHPVTVVCRQPDLTSPGSPPSAVSVTMTRDNGSAWAVAGQPSRPGALSDKRRAVHKEVYSDSDLSSKVGINIKTLITQKMLMTILYRS